MARQATLQWVVATYQNDRLRHGRGENLLEKRQAVGGLQIVLATAVQVKTFFAAAVEPHCPIAPQRPVDDDVARLTVEVLGQGKCALVTVRHGIAAGTEVPQNRGRRRKLHMPGQPFRFEHPGQDAGSLDLGREHALEVSQVDRLQRGGRCSPRRMDDPMNLPKTRLGLLYGATQANFIADIGLHIKQAPDTSIQRLDVPDEGRCQR